MKISGIDGKLYIKRCLIHVPIGLITGWIISLGDFFLVTIGVLFYIGFLRYELNEDFCIKDYAYPDIAGSLWGLVIYVVIWKCIHG